MGQGAAGAAGAASSAGGGLAGAASAAMPWVSLGLGAANIATSLVEASKQKELQRAADRQAEKSAAEQERLLSQNFFEALQVPMQAYDREFRETTAQQQQAMAALQEGDPRLLLGGVGKVQAIAAEQEAKTRDALGKDLFDIGKLQALEAGQTADQLAKMQGDRLAGAQKASAAAQMARIDNQQKAIAAGGDLLKGLGGLIPEYSKTDINANNTDMSTVLKPMGMANSGLNAASQLSENTTGSLNPLYKQYSFGSLAAPSIESQLQSGTANALGDMQNKYGWMDQLAKFGAVRF
jgi:hypothetical protein